MISIADPDLGKEEIARVKNIIESGMVADGPVVRDFEESFSDFCGAKHGVATSNGTTALHATFEACGIGEGDTIVTTPFSFVASANAIRLSGADPCFADINPKTFNLDPEAVEQTIKENDEDVDAILAVHLYGLPADMYELREIADEYDALLIEDAAQAHGAAIKGKKVGSIGDAACFSFYPTKNMTTGEGGMVVTNDEDIAKNAERFINHGRSDTYEHVEVGHNFRMTSIAAAIGKVQLEKLPSYIESRRDNAETLTNKLERTSITTPHEPSARKHVYHQYTIRTDQRDELTEALDRNNIGYGIYYPHCIHEQPAYSKINKSAPVAEEAAKEVLSLPVHPKIDQKALQKIVDVMSDHGN